MDASMRSFRPRLDRSIVICIRSAKRRLVVRTVVNMLRQTTPLYCKHYTKKRSDLYSEWHMFWSIVSTLSETHYILSTRMLAVAL